MRAPPVKQPAIHATSQSSNIENATMSQKRLIFHLISHLDGYGTSRQLQLLARRQIADGYSVCIAALRASSEVYGAWKAEGLQVQVLDRRWRLDPVAAWRLARLLRSERPALCHVWDSQSLCYLAGARWEIRTPLIASFTHLPQRPWFVGQVDRLALESKCACANLDACGIVREHVKAIPPGVAFSSVDAVSRKQLLANLALSKDTRLIAMAGKLTRSKRIDEAIWCFELVRTLHERAALLVFGGGPDRHRLERFARLTSEPKVVRFLGYRADWHTMLSHADLFWHTGESPGVSSSVLEAMAAKVPVVVSDTPDYRTIVEHEVTGFLTPIGSRAGLARHTLHVLEDANLANQIGCAASEYIKKNYQSSAITLAYQDIYRSLLVGGK